MLFCVQRSTEEEEDIDRVLAKMKASGGRGNLLSVVAVSMLGQLDIGLLEGEWIRFQGCQQSN